MMKNKETQELLRLIKENPELEVNPMIATYGIDDDFDTYLGYMGTPRVDKYYMGNDRVYLYEYDFEDVTEEYKDSHDKPKNKTWEEWDDEVDIIVEKFNWIKTITFYVSAT